MLREVQFDGQVITVDPSLFFEDWRNDDAQPISPKQEKQVHARGEVTKKANKGLQSNTFAAAAKSGQLLEERKTQRETNQRPPQRHIVVASSHRKASRPPSGQSLRANRRLVPRAEAASLAPRRQALYQALAGVHLADDVLTDVACTILLAAGCAGCKRVKQLEQWLSQLLPLAEAERAVAFGGLPLHNPFVQMASRWFP